MYKNNVSLSLQAALAPLGPMSPWIFDIWEVIETYQKSIQDFGGDRIHLGANNDMNIMKTHKGSAYI